MGRRGARRGAGADTGIRVSQLAYAGEQLVVLSMPSHATERPEALTDAEWQVARMAASGKPNREIAQLRGTSVRTVANQLASTFRKLGVASRTDLALLLRDRGPSRDAPE